MQVIIESAINGFVIITTKSRRLPDGTDQFDKTMEVATSTDDLINRLNTLFAPTEGK